MWRLWKQQRYVIDSQKLNFIFQEIYRISQISRGSRKVYSNLHSLFLEPSLDIPSPNIDNLLSLYLNEQLSWNLFFQVLFQPFHIASGFQVLGKVRSRGNLIIKYRVENVWDRLRIQNGHSTTQNHLYQTISLLLSRYSAATTIFSPYSLLQFKLPTLIYHFFNILSAN